MKTCPICESTDLGYFASVEDRRLIICSRCRHVTWQHLPCEEELSTYYGSSYTGGHGQLDIQLEGYDGYVEQVNVLLDRLRQKPGAPKVLDYGSSYPVFLKAAVDERGCWACGVDYSPEVIEWGRAQGITMLHVSEWEDKLGYGSVDIVRCSHVLEHCIDPLSVFSRVVRKVRSGGVVLVTQPSIPACKASSCGVVPCDAVYPEHLHFFSPVSFCALLEKAGCVVEDFITELNAKQNFVVYDMFIDYEFSRQEMCGYRDKKWFASDKYCLYPYYCGANATAFCRKP